MAPINVKLFFDEVFNQSVTDYNIAIYHRNELIYERHPNQGNPSVHNSITYAVKDHEWAITSWPAPEIAIKQHSWFPMSYYLLVLLLL